MVSSVLSNFVLSNLFLSDVAKPNIVKSASDRREYRFVELSNALKAVLVSDSSATLAAAAVDVRSGSANDPEDVPGLAHFCEHMLFLASVKYPVEQDYDAFLKRHGGFSNAFTADSHTNFYFEVLPESLREALDRFAQFFIAPLFSVGGVAREMHAVDSEHAKNLQSDAWRLWQLGRSLAAAGHPHNHFGTGSLQTLNRTGVHSELMRWYGDHYLSHTMTLAIVGAEDLDTLQSYAADLFSAVPRSHPPPSGAAAAPPPPPVAPSASLFATAPAAFLVRPVRSLELLRIMWSLPPVESEYRSRPLRLVSRLLGGESAGSLRSALVRRGWIEGVTTSVERQPAYSLLVVDLDLTARGLAHWREALEVVYAALRAIRGRGVTQQVFDALHSEDEISFRFKAKEEASDYASDLAARLHLYPPQELLTAPEVTPAFDGDRTRELLRQLQPTSMLALLVSQTLTANATDGASSERWYGTQYWPIPLPDDFVAGLAAEEPRGGHSYRGHSYDPPAGGFCTGPGDGASEEGERAVRQKRRPDLQPGGCRAECDAEPLCAGFAEGGGTCVVYGAVADDPPPPWEARPGGTVVRSGGGGGGAQCWRVWPPSSELSPPPRNPYLPTDFELLEASSSPFVSDPPALLRRGARSRLWHRAEVSFGLPVAAVRVALHTRAVSAREGGEGGGEGAAFALLHAIYLEMQLREAAWDASRAGLAVSLSATSTGFELSGHGYAQTLPAYMLTVLRQARSLQPDALRFATVKALVERQLADEDKAAAYQVAYQAWSHLLLRVAPTPAEQLAAVRSIRLPQLVRFAADALSSWASSDFLFFGNLDAAGAVDAYEEQLGALSEDGAAPAGLPAVPSQQQAVADLGGRALLRAVAHPNPQETNSAVRLTLVLGELSAREAATAQLLAKMVEPAFFASLRTRQQLGYLVWSFGREVRGVSLLYFIVQSSSASPRHVTASIHAFLEEEAEALLNSTAAADFAAYAAAARKELLDPPEQLEAAAEEAWGQIAAERFCFARRREVAVALDGVSLADVQALLASLVAADSAASRLLVQVHSPEHPVGRVADELPESSRREYSPLEDEGLARFRAGRGFFAGEPCAVAPPLPHGHDSADEVYGWMALGAIASLLGGISLLSLRLLAGACRSSLSSLPFLQLQPSSTMSELEPALDASAASPKARRSSAEELQLGHSGVGHHAKPAATFA